ncbi:hypothetical protein D3C80_2145830 [compost metagenome]
MDQAEDDVHHGGHNHHINRHVSDEAHYARHAVGLDSRDHRHEGRVDVANYRLGQQHPAEETEQHQCRAHHQ